MINKNSQADTNINTDHPKFAESVVEILDIIKYKGGLAEVIKQSQDKRKFTGDKITFSEIDGKKQKGKKIVAE